jgi:hypothetical protein
VETLVVAVVSWPSSPPAAACSCWAADGSVKSMPWAAVASWWMPSTSVPQSAAISGGASTAAYWSASCCRAGASFVGSLLAWPTVALTDCSRETASLQKAAASARVPVPCAGALLEALEVVEEELELPLDEEPEDAEVPWSDPPQAVRSRTAAADRPAVSRVAGARMPQR